MADLAELLERVRAAVAPDRRLDLDICAALGTLEYGPTSRGWTRHPHPELTASLDAALALVEREFSGGLGWWVEMETAGMGATICGPDGERFSGGGVGKDLPTALLAALLSALIAQAAQDSVGSSNPRG